MSDFPAANFSNWTRFLPRLVGPRSRRKNSQRRRFSWICFGTRSWQGRLHKSELCPAVLGIGIDAGVAGAMAGQASPAWLTAQRRSDFHEFVPNKKVCGRMLRKWEIFTEYPLSLFLSLFCSSSKSTKNSGPRFELLMQNKNLMNLFLQAVRIEWNSRL